MFCSECGAQAEGKFCWKCGHPLHAGGAGGSAVATLAVVAKPEPEPLQDWSQELRYDILCAQPAVRKLIETHGAQAKKPVSGEELLKVVDKLSLTVVPLETISQISMPLWESLGLKGLIKTRRQTVARPAGQVIVAALCSLAKHSQTLSRVDQAADGCTLHADQPSDIRSFKGEITITIKVQEPGVVLVDAGAGSKGQYYDWGKSNASLDRLFQDLRDLPLTA